MTKQSHSHPVLRRQVPEKQTESKSDIVPVEEFPVNVPSFAKDEHAAERRSRARVQYADYAVLNDMQTGCNLIRDEFKHRAVLYIGSEEYDYSTITILQGLSSLGFEIYTLKKPNINSWFHNEVVDSTSGLKVDFALFNVGWGTRWSYYHRYQLRRFPVIAIDSVLTGSSGNAGYSEKHIPDSVDELEIQPYRWIDAAKPIEFDAIFSWRIQEAVYLPPGIHYESLDAGVESIHPNAGPRSLEPIHIPLQDQGEAIIPAHIASLIAKDAELNIHGWHNWIRWHGTFSTLNKSAIAVCDQAGIHQRFLWDALAAGCLVMFNESFGASKQPGYPITCISPFTVFQSQDELQDKIDWLTEHPDLLNRLRQDSERLALKYFTPVPLAKRFLWYIHHEAMT